MKRARTPLENSLSKESFIYNILPLDVMLHIIECWIGFDWTKVSIYVLYKLFVEMCGGEARGFSTLLTVMLPRLTNVPPGSWTHTKILTSLKNIKSLNLSTTVLGQMETPPRERHLTPCKERLKIFSLFSTLTSLTMEGTYVRAEYGNVFSSWSSLENLTIIGGSEASIKGYDVSESLFLQCTSLKSLSVLGMDVKLPTTATTICSQLTRLVYASKSIGGIIQPIMERIYVNGSLPHLRELILHDNARCTIDMIDRFRLLENLECALKLSELNFDSFSNATRLKSLAIRFIPVVGIVRDEYEHSRSGMLTCLTNLERLVMRGDGCSSEISLEGLSKLKCLSLMEHQLYQTGRQFHNKPLLKVVSLTSTQILDGGASLTKTIPSLTSLFLSRCHSVDNSTLTQLTGLACLTLSGAVITDQALSRMTHLETLCIESPKHVWVTDEGIRHLTLLKSLSIVQPKNSSYNPNLSPRAIQNMSNLTRLHVFEEPGVVESVTPFDKIINQLLPQQRYKWPFLHDVKHAYMK